MASPAFGSSAGQRHIPTVRRCQCNTSDALMQPLFRHRRKLREGEFGKSSVALSPPTRQHFSSSWRCRHGLWLTTVVA